MQPEDAAEQRKASGVAGTCSGTAEDIAVRRMPRGMLGGLGETLQNVVGWRWKSRQPGDAVGRHAEDRTMVGGGAGDRTMVGGGAGDRSGGVRRVAKRKACLGAEDTSGGGRCIRRRETRWKVEAESEAERCGIRGFPLQ